MTLEEFRVCDPRLRGHATFARMRQIFAIGLLAFAVVVANTVGCGGKNAGADAGGGSSGSLVGNGGASGGGGTGGAATTSGVTGAKRLDALTTAEWQTLCDWTAQHFG